MENKFNKRGAGASGIQFFAIVIVAAFVVVLAVGVFSGAFGQIIGATEQLGGDLEKRFEVCKAAGKLNPVFWCEYIVIRDEELTWANCAHPRILSALKKDKEFKMPTFEDVNCVSGVLGAQERLKICDKVAEDGDDIKKVVINDAKACVAIAEEKKGIFDNVWETFTGFFG
jgi:hypothetical protein